MISLKDKKLFLFDLDGVFYKGKENPVKIGGTKVTRKIRAENKKLLVLTNDSTDSRDKIYDKFVRLKIDIRIDEILTSGMLCADYILEKYGKAVKYFLLGEAGLGKELTRAGLEATSSTKADVVVVGLDRHLTYGVLEKARQVVTNGADIIATHKSRVYMYKSGPATAAGPIVVALEYATAKRATVIGKPSVLMFRYALKKFHCEKQDAVMTGDQLDTDILGANRAGIDSILVRTGIDRRGTDNIKPFAIVGNVDDLARFI
jgi:4-nitrophenyl phosphatase